MRSVLPTLPLADFYEIGRHERPICRYISDTVTVSASGHEHHEQAIVPYAGENTFLVRIPSHVLRLFMKHGRKGEVVLTYIHPAVVALENLSET